MRQREKERASELQRGVGGRRAGGELARGSLVEGGCHCTGEPGGRRRGKGNAEGLPAAEEVNPKACASPRRAQLGLRLGSGVGEGGSGPWNGYELVGMLKKNIIITRTNLISLIKKSRIANLLSVYLFERNVSGATLPLLSQALKNLRYLLKLKR